MNGRTFRVKPNISAAILAVITFAIAPRSAVSQPTQTLKAGVHNVDPKTEFIVGAHYFFGGSKPPNYNKAQYWLRLSAHQGDADAEDLLGSIYDLGLGVQN